MKTDPIAAAQQTVAGLETQFAENEAALSRNADEREGVAFAGLTGNAEARARLDALGTEHAALLVRRDDIEAALAEARRRVMAARIEADGEAKKQLAREARKMARQLRAAAQLVDETAAQLGAAITALMDIERAMALKAIPGAPNAHLHGLWLLRVLSTALRPGMVQAQPHGGDVILPLVAPGDRKPMAAIIDATAAGITAWADQVLAVGDTEKAA